MRKRAIWVFVGLCVAIATVWFARKDNLPAVRLPEGETLRVLDVTIGTNITFSVEPFWKQALRAVAPASLGIKVFGQSRGYTTTADYETLAVLMDPLPGKRRTIRVETVFPDGTVKSAIGGWAPNYRSPILFRSYPREESQIDLRFWITSNDVVSLRLKNKRVASREKWTTGTLPQTNLIQETEVVLKEWRFPYGSDAGELMLAARSTTDSGVGWLRWQTTLLDSTGKLVYRPTEPPSFSARGKERRRLQAAG